MYNTYFSSAVFTLRTDGSRSFSFNDYSNLLTEKFDKSPSSSKCCSCCNCCSCCSLSSSFPTHRVPINPSLFYGLRQSTLIQWSPCRRLIFGGRDRCSYKVPDYGLYHGCFDVSCSFKERNSRERIDRRRKSRIGRLNLRDRRCLSGSDDAEAVISFLSEEVSGKYLGDRDRNGSSTKRVEIEKRSNYDGECWHGKKKNFRLGSIKRESKSQIRSVTAESKKEGYRRNEGREECQRREERDEYRRKEEMEDRKTVARGEKQRERKVSSSFSSYYSLSSTGDFESDKEAQNEHVGLPERSSCVYEKETRSGEDDFEGQMVQEFEMHGHVGQGKFLEQRTRTDADWELRKITEKKLTETEETQYQKKAQHSRIVRSSGSDHWRASSSYKQLDDKNENFTSEDNHETGTRKQYSQTGGLVTQHSQFRRNYQEMTDTNLKRTSQHERQSIGREGELTVGSNLVEEKRCRYHETLGETTGNGNIGRNTLQLTEISEMGNVVERNSNLRKQSESRMKIWEEDIALRSEREAILQSETEMKNQEGSSVVVSHSVEETKERRSHIDQKAIQGIKSRKGSQDVTNIAAKVTNVSVIHSSDVYRVSDSQVTSGKKMIDQGSESAVVVNPIQEARARDDLTHERIAGVKSTNKTLRATEVLSFQEKKSQEASSSHASMDMDSQARLQQTNVKEGDHRNLQPTMMPPSHQVVDRGLLQGETSESSSSAIYTYPERRSPTSPQEPYGRDWRGEIYGDPSKVVLPEDAIASAHRLEDSSMKFVGEFVEIAKNDGLTSEIQKEKVSDAKLESEGEKDKRKSSNQYGSEGLQRMELDAGQPSGGSGEKGPSDEMWDVTDPSAKEPPETEATEDSRTINNAVVRRTGRSLWSVISDIVRLRWSSRVETPKPGKRLGGKSLSNDSVSSEAWFSGRDPEEISDKNVEIERRSMTREATSSQRQQLMQASFQGWGEVSGTHASKIITEELEANVSSPPTILKSGSISKGISTPYEEEDKKSFEGTQSQDGKSCYVSPPSTDAGESSSLLVPSSAMSTIVVEESDSRGRIDVSASGSMEMMEQPFSAKSTEASGYDEKDRELKQRRLQRNKQVVRDKFDEWEEAYMCEREQQRIDEMFMREALLEAKKAADTWEVPVGAVLVQHGKIIARGYNLVEELRDSTAHAEMICIREASNQLRTWRLAECALYVTLEPCPMCAGAILQARIDTLVWGAPNKLLGADGSWIRLFPDTGAANGSEVTDKAAAPPHPFHPKMTIRRRILATECADAMQQFFQLRRKIKVKNEDLPPKPSLPIASHQSKFLQKMHNIFHALLCL